MLSFLLTKIRVLQYLINNKNSCIYKIYCLQEKMKMNIYELLEKAKNMKLDKKKVKKLRKILKEQDRIFANESLKKKITDSFLNKHYSSE